MSLYRRGQPVWLLAKDLPIPTSSHKLRPCYVGTYIVERIINPTAVRLSQPSSLWFHSVFHVSKLKSVPSLLLSQRHLRPMSPKMVTQFGLYGSYCMFAAGEGVSSF